MSFVETHNKFIESQKLTIQRLAEVSAKMDSDMINLAEENRKLKQKIAGITTNYHNMIMMLKNSPQSGPITRMLEENLGAWLTPENTLDIEIPSGLDTSDQGSRKTRL